MKIKKIVNKLINENISIASMESFTGGLFASKLVNFPGISKIFKGSLVLYQNSIKEKFNINTFNGVINKNTALEMSKKGKEFFDVNYCISFTGNAGPSSLDNLPAGLIFIGINEHVFEILLKNKSRNKTRKFAVKFALEQLWKLISN